MDGGNSARTSARIAANEDEDDDPDAAAPAPASSPCCDEDEEDDDDSAEDGELVAPEAQPHLLPVAARLDFDVAELGARLECNCAGVDSPPPTGPHTNGSSSRHISVGIQYDPKVTW